MTKKKAYSFQLFLLVLPFIVLVLLFCYYPLYGWLYAFYDYKPPRTLANSAFVGFKWFGSLVSSKVKMKQILQVLKNTFAMSGLTLGTSWERPRVCVAICCSLDTNRLSCGGTPTVCGRFWTTF